jgi:hypothetical protein
VALGRVREGVQGGVNPRDVYDPWAPSASRRARRFGSTGLTK